jgi:hypothetical protein
VPPRCGGTVGLYHDRAANASARRPGFSGTAGRARRARHVPGRLPGRPSLPPLRLLSEPEA